MTIKQVKEFFIGMEEIPCPLTERLVKAGYQQVWGGYIDRAMREGLLVDYKKNAPSQAITLSVANSSFGWLRFLEQWIVQH